MTRKTETGGAPAEISEERLDEIAGGALAVGTASKLEEPRPDIVVATGPGGGPIVRVFDGATGVKRS